VPYTLFSSDHAQGGDRAEQPSRSASMGSIGRGRHRHPLLEAPHCPSTVMVVTLDHTGSHHHQFLTSDPQTQGDNLWYGWSQANVLVGASHMREKFSQTILSLPTCMHALIREGVSTTCMVNKIMLLLAVVGLIIINKLRSCRPAPMIGRGRCLLLSLPATACNAS
jgi:hypothetical protein